MTIRKERTPIHYLGAQPRLVTGGHPLAGRRVYRVTECGAGAAMVAVTSVAADVTCAVCLDAMTAALN